MRLSIEHRTEYCYEKPVSHSTQYLRLTPKTSSRQRVISWDLSMPETAPRSTDGFGNILHVLTLDRPHDTIAIAARGEVEIIDSQREDDDQRLSPLIYQRFTRITRADPMIRDFAERFAGRPELQKLTELSAALLELMPYVPGSTKVSRASLPSRLTAPTRIAPSSTAYRPQGGSPRRNRRCPAPSWRSLA